MTVDRDTLAELLGVTPRTIRRWVDAGMPSQGTGRTRRYVVSTCTDWRVQEERRRVLENHDADGSAWKAARSRKEQALADRHELEAQDRAGQLVDAVSVRDAFAAKLSRIREALRRWPGEIAPGLSRALDVDAGELEAELAGHMAAVVARTDHLTTESP